MIFEVQQDIKIGDVIGYDLKTKKILRILDNSDFHRVINQGNLIENASKSLEKGEKIELDIQNDTGKMTATIAAVRRLKQVTKTLQEGKQKQELMKKANLIKIR
jgi:hypothetical protein